jgi:hypothetical protein
MDFNRFQYPLPGTERQEYPSYEPHFAVPPVTASHPPTAFPTGFPLSYQSYPQPQLLHPPAPVNPTPVLHPGICSLIVRQQPKEALVTQKGKEKFRKPLDPPPIVQIQVDARHDPQQHHLQNPYLFVSVTLFKASVDEPIDAKPNDSLTGTLVSSLHRLKDVENKEGGFFVYGDISIKMQGTYRLRFNLYELEGNAYRHLASISSDRFNVVAQKDFKGLVESTYLSRTFSDQGVRLRLRKESRGMNNKRSNSDEQQEVPGKRTMTNFANVPYDYQMMPQHPYYHPN